MSSKPSDTEEGGGGGFKECWTVHSAAEAPLKTLRIPKLTAHGVRLQFAARRNHGNTGVLHAADWMVERNGDRRLARAAHISELRGCCCQETREALEIQL